MARHIRNFAVSLVASPLLCTAAQSEVQRTAEREITVIGKSLPEVRQEVTQYVTEVGIAVGETPAARWIDPVCPKAVGVQPDVAARIVTQVRAVAQQAGAPVAKAKCRGNLIIAFTDDAPGLVKKISKRQVLGELSFEARRALETGTMPVRWWYSHEILGEDGSPTQGNVTSPALKIVSIDGVSGSGEMPRNDRTGMSNRRTASLIAESSMRAIRHATVVVDVNHAHGTGLTSLTDLASIVGLAEIRPGAAPPNSILNLFGSADAQRLSRNDLAMLKGLYTMPLLRKAEQHRRSLVTNIMKFRYDPKRDAER